MFPDTVDEIKVSDPAALKMPPPVCPAVFPVTVRLSVRLPSLISNPPPRVRGRYPLTSDLCTVTVPSTWIPPCTRTGTLHSGWTKELGPTTMLASEAGFAV